MLKNAIREADFQKFTAESYPISYAVYLGLLTFPPKLHGRSAYWDGEFAALTALYLDKKHKLSKKGQKGTFLNEVLNLCESHLAELSRIRPLPKKRTGSEFIKLCVSYLAELSSNRSFLKKQTSSEYTSEYESQNKLDTEKAKCGSLSKQLKILVSKSQENAFQGFSGQNSVEELEQALKFLEGIREIMNKGVNEEKELVPLYHAAAANVRHCSLSETEKLGVYRASELSFDESLCEKEKLGVYRASELSFDESILEGSAQNEESIESTQDGASKEESTTIETQQQETETGQDEVAPSTTVVPPTVTKKRDFLCKFPSASLFAVFGSSKKKKGLALPFAECQFEETDEEIAFWKDKLKLLGHKVRRQCPDSVQHRSVKDVSTSLYVKAVEDLNLYCLANGIDLGVNQAFDIEAPALVDVTQFLKSHDVGFKDAITIRAILSTVGYPGSDSRALAAAIQKTPAQAGKQLVMNDHEVALINEISAFQIRTKVDANIKNSFEPSTQMVNRFLDTNGGTIPYIPESSLLNYLAFVGSYKDECIMRALRLEGQKPSTSQSQTVAADKRNLYCKGVYNLFAAWHEINGHLGSERPKERIFCADFISKLVKQSAGKYSEALVNGIANYCAFHENGADQDFLQPFLRDNKYLYQFLESRWDHHLSKIDISRSFNVLAMAGMPGTNHSDILKAINNRAFTMMQEYLDNYDLHMLSRQLLIVAAATNQFDKLAVLKSKTGPEYAKTFDSVVSEILFSEQMTCVPESERIAKSIIELKTHLFAGWLQLPSFSALESYLKSEGSEIPGQPDPLEFLQSIGKIKRESQNSENSMDPRFEYLLVTHKLVDSMIKAKLPYTMFNDENFPDLRYLDRETIRKYDEIIDENQVTKADRILAQIYRVVRYGGAREHLVEAADAVNLFCLAMGASSINKERWFQPNITDAMVKNFKQRNGLPQGNAEDELIKKFLAPHTLSKTGTINDPAIVHALKIRRKSSDYKANLKEKASLPTQDSEKSDDAHTNNCGDSEESV